jgi:hypothetical protein
MKFMTNGPADLDQFLVAARNGAATGDLAAFEQALQEFPDATIVARGGRPDQPHLVVALTADSFEKLKSRFGAALIMERNARLNPL